ncbi:MAG: D-tyrosyl-tRNA(Tyr) deacylase [Planctomycetes bacterium]|nr:D-tyrosyl-tRNA(Tyr) deacylase [Planctomycetota bacterium]
MRAVVQRVFEAGVEVGGATTAEVASGLLVYLGVHREDQPADADYLAEKVRFLRVFSDAEGRMNLDVVQAGGAVLAVSAFTVQADARRGRRPGFEDAAAPEAALPLYQRFCDRLATAGAEVRRGSFGDHMSVRSINDGPICVLLDSRRLF